MESQADRGPARQTRKGPRAPAVAVAGLRTPDPESRRRPSSRRALAGLPGWASVVLAPPHARVERLRVKGPVPPPARRTAAVCPEAQAQVAEMRRIGLRLRGAAGAAGPATAAPSGPAAPAPATPPCRAARPLAVYRHGLRARAGAADSGRGLSGARAGHKPASGGSAGPDPARRGPGDETEPDSNGRGPGR